MTAHATEVTAELVQAARAGFESLTVAEKYKESALLHLQQWLHEPVFADYVPQLVHLIKTKQWDVLLDSFFQVIPFGTGGRRGMVGIGPNRINSWTIMASAQGHAQFLEHRFKTPGKKRGIVVAYDVRKYDDAQWYDPNQPNPVRGLSCRQLARQASQVYVANGFTVWFFEDARSTPELSFAIRHLNAVAGIMISASHNPPTDNGKKVFDQTGGQLIPPFDQELVDLVTNEVFEIKNVGFDEAVRGGRICLIGGKIDQAYEDAVCALSLSKRRNVSILYSPLHGTGITTYYRILKKLGFDIQLDPKTAHYSGAFENVTFNIPNPEVVQSFDSLVAHASDSDFDLLVNSDPDADRIGVMVKHQQKWRYLTGNEIGILLSHYGLSKLKESQELSEKSEIVKTLVTSSLISVMARAHGIQCVGDLLVGFKYIAHEMNRLQAQNRSSDFVLGVEESHGFCIGDYIREKDGAAAAVWLCELASELKEKNQTLVDELDAIFSRFGYCHNQLSEIRLLGAVGMEQISRIQSALRENKIERFGNWLVKKRTDYWAGLPHVSQTDTASRNVIEFELQADERLQRAKVTVRPSGTEPKLKVYFELFAKPVEPKKQEREKKQIAEKSAELEKAVLNYCYGVLGIDFPERGFLLFSQLPLSDKLKYFEIEDELVALQSIPGAFQRKTAVLEKLAFLGSDPLEKINRCFKARFNQSVWDFFDI